MGFKDEFPIRGAFMATKHVIIVIDIVITPKIVPRYG
jgi:hypothetical protein